MTVSTAGNGNPSAMFRLPPLSHRHGSHLPTAESDPERKSASNVGWDQTGPFCPPAFAAMAVDPHRCLPECLNPPH